MNIFINENEQRLRAGWRLVLQFIFVAILSGLFFWMIYALGGMPNTLAQATPNFLGIVGSVWLAARFLDKRPIFEYGLQFNARWRNDFFAGVGIGSVAIGTIFAVEWSWGWVTITGYGWQATSAGTFAGLFAASFVAMLMVGFCEELFSRGYQVLNLTEGLRYPSIGSRGAVIIAVLATSSLFGLLHLGNPNASAVSTTNIILAGIALAIPYVLTGRLALSIGLHFSWNFVQGSICGFPVSGMNFQTSLIQINQLGTDIWTGGSFGPEAGVIGLIGMAIMVGLSCVYIKVSIQELRIAGLFQKDDQTALKADEHTP